MQANIPNPSCSVLPKYSIGRQPIIDAHLHIHGFEMLYRAGESTSPMGLSVSGDMATAHVLSTCLCDTNLPELREKHGQLFINMTRDYLLNIPLLDLPCGIMVFEILEDVLIDDILIKRLTRLRSMRYQFALDDFTLNSNSKRLLPLATYIKLDVKALSNIDLENHVRQLRSMGTFKLVAEKVETWDEYHHCAKLGFDYFQGFFYEKAEILTGTALIPNRSIVHRLISRLNDPEVQSAEVQKLISADPVLSLKLLRYAGNTSLLTNRFSDLNQVIETLGPNRLRSIATMFSMGNLQASPEWYVRAALTRAHTCQLVALEHSMPQPEQYFIAGILSMLDSFIDDELQNGLHQFPISRQIKQSIIQGTGHIGLILRAVIAHENPLQTVPCISPTEGASTKFNNMARAIVDEIMLTTDDALCKRI